MTCELLAWTQMLALDGPPAPWEPNGRGCFTRMRIHPTSLRSGRTNPASVEPRVWRDGLGRRAPPDAENTKRLAASARQIKIAKLRG
jgi:hypothetical protein